jgi:hypothetical protein
MNVGQQSGRRGPAIRNAIISTIGQKKGPPGSGRTNHHRASKRPAPPSIIRRFRK